MKKINNFFIYRAMKIAYSKKKNATAQFVKILNKSLKKSNNPINKFFFDHPLSHLLKYYSINKNANFAKECLKDLLKINSSQLSNYNIKKNYPMILQNKILIKVPETRGISLQLDNNFTAKDLKKFTKIFKILKDNMSFDWKSFVRVIKCITIVKFIGRNDTKYFSGTFSPSLGAMHMCKPFSNLNVLECLTHEAAHLWLDQLEEKQEFALDGWSNSKYCSPWRPDKRPISGIIHGVYVFSRVALALYRFSKLKINKPLETNKITERIAYLISQINEGVKEIFKSKELTTLGKKITRISSLTAKNLEKKLPKKIIEKFKGIVLKNRKKKIESW